MKRQSMWKVILASLVSGIMLVAYNNCSSEHGVGQDLTSNLGMGPWTCADQLDSLSLFSRTYHPFLMNNCVACHSGAGPGPGAFASSGIQLAYDSFDALGFARVGHMAVETHQSNGQAGPQHAGTVEDLNYRYVTGLSAIELCSSESGGINEVQDSEDRIRFRSQPINPDPDNAVVVSWNLQADAFPHDEYVPSDFAGMRLEVDVQLFERPGILNYVVSNPRIITTTGDVHIVSLLFKLNGQPTPAQRSFYLVEKDIRAWNGDHPDFNRPGGDFRRQASLVSGGALVMLGEVRTTDVLSVSIERLERVVLPPPDLGPAVRFESVSQQVEEGYRIVDIPIVLDRASSQVTFAEVVFGDETTVRDECCRTTRNDVDGLIEVRHFERDIQDFDMDPNIKINRRLNFDGQNNQRGRYLITFRDGETRHLLRIKVVEDDRAEANELLHLRIDQNSLRGLQPAATNQEHRLTIIDDDPVRPIIAETYSRLLREGGLLANECLRCHNSVLNRGGYDITHYELLISRGILIPGDPMRSEMFVRMNAEVPNKLPMPLTGLLDVADRDRVASWILNGALND